MRENIGIGLDMNKIFEKCGNEYRELPSYKKVFQCALYPEPFRFCTDRWQIDTWIESDKRDSNDDLWTAAMPREASIADLSGSGSIFPIQFSEDVKTRLSVNLGDSYNHQINIIDESGCRPFAGALNITVDVDDISCGSAWHSPPVIDEFGKYQEEMISFFLRIPPERMIWLRETLLDKPHALLDIYMNIAAFERDGQFLGLLPSNQPVFAIETGSWTPVVTARMTITVHGRAANREQ